eukprot:jgi/Tetstr1/431889/TSEL_021378.t1
MLESNGSEAESAGSEGSGSDEEGGGHKPGRERLAGLSYKLRRDATTRAMVRKFIGRKAKQMEAWLTHAVGDDDTWQFVYAEGGPGAQFGAPSGGGEGVEQQQRHGDVDAHGTDGEEAGIVEEADVVGQPADVRAAHTPRFILGALPANYPELLASILESKQFQHHLKASERPPKWDDADMEKLVHMVLPYGNFMIEWPSVEDMLKGQGGEELASVGLSTTEDMI